MLSELSGISSLLTALDCRDFRWLENSEARALKKRVKFFYSRTWPDDRPGGEPGNLSGWDGLGPTAILIDLTFDSNCSELSRAQGAASILSCSAARWPTSREIRSVLRALVFGQLDIIDPDALWYLTCQSEPNYAGFENLRFASELAFSEFELSLSRNPGEIS